LSVAGSCVCDRIGSEPVSGVSAGVVLLGSVTGSVPVAVVGVGSVISYASNPKRFAQDAQNPDESLNFIANRFIVPITTIAASAHFTVSAPET